MTSLAIVGIGVQREEVFWLSNGNPLEDEQIEEALNVVAGGGNRKGVTVTEPGDGLPDGDRRAQPLRIGLKRINEGVCVWFSSDDRDESGRIHKDRHSPPDKSSKKALSAV